MLDTSTSAPPAAAGRRRDRLVVALLMLAFVAQSVGSMRWLSATSDETSHLPSGYTYLATGKIVLNRQHPPLIKELCALPLVALLGPRTWAQVGHTSFEGVSEWSFGRDFLYSHAADRLLFWGRLPVVLLAAILGLYLYRWARELFGEPAGWTALFLYAFSPNVLAHSHLVTMDLGLTCFAFAALYHLWRFARGSGWRHAVASGAALGLALGTKFSALVFVLVAALLLGLGLLPRRGPAARGLPRVRRAAAAGVAMAVVAAAVLWVVYLLPSDPRFYWEGVQRVNRDHLAGYASYLWGSFGYGGWWYYFLAAFAIKTPLPTLLLVLVSPWLVLRLRAPSWLDEAFVLVPVVVFTAVTSALADNIGLRYLLPIYPLLFLFVSRAGLLLRRGRAWAIGGAALAAWYVGGALFIYPNHLAYFNEAVGGPSQGYRYLDDSNVEWGEGLKQLEAYLDREGIERVKLRYVWNGSPEYYGITYDPVTTREWERRPPPGIYAVSTQALIRGRFPVQGLSTDWLAHYRPVDRVGYSFYIFEFH